MNSPGIVNRLPGGMAAVLGLFFLFFPDGTDGEPDVTATEAPVHIVGIEAHAPRAVRVVRSEGRRPVVAVGARIVEVGAEPVASSGKEDAVTVGCYHQPAVYAISS